MLGSRDRKREHFIEGYPFSVALQNRVRTEHPEISAKDRAMVFEGLRHWFQVCRRVNDLFVAMPSIAVDGAWHEFILFTRDYAQFCDRGLGRFLHHTPTGGSAAPDPRNAMRDGYVLAWHHACAVDGIDPYEPERLPLLFAIDECVGIPGGFRYDLTEIAAERSAARRRAERKGAGALRPFIAGGSWWPGDVRGRAGRSATTSAAAGGCAGGTFVASAGGRSVGGGCGGGADGGVSSCGGGGGCGGGGCGGG